MFACTYIPLSDISGLRLYMLRLKWLWCTQWQRWSLLHKYVDLSMVEEVLMHCMYNTNALVDLVMDRNILELDTAYIVLHRYFKAGN